MRFFFVIIYYLILIRLPHSTVPVVGQLTERLKEIICRRIFKFCGTNVNIGRGARFGKGYGIQIGNNSGIGMNAKIPDNVIIGEDVMMGVNVQIIGSKHNFERTDIPMRKQGSTKLTPVVIEDDVWIGNNAIILPERRIRKGTIVAAGSVVTKDFPEFSIIGGNPARLIKSRLDTSKINDVS